MKKTFLILFSIIGLTASAQALQKPVKVYSKDGITVASYDFNSLEPLLKMQNDTIYVVNFWATWCQPCIAELPNFEKLNKRFATKKVKVILVSLDMPKQVESSLIPFIKRKKIQSLVVHLNDPYSNSWINKIDSQWSGAIPATIIYNKNSKQFYEQSFTYADLEQKLLLIK